MTNWKEIMGLWVWNTFFMSKLFQQWHVCLLTNGVKIFQWSKYLLLKIFCVINFLWWIPSTKIFLQTNFPKLQCVHTYTGLLITNSVVMYLYNCAYHNAVDIQFCRCSNKNQQCYNRSAHNFHYYHHIH